MHNHLQPPRLSDQWSIPSAISQYLCCPIAIVSPSTLPLFPRPFQFLLPQQSSLGTDRLRGAMVLRGCYRGREPVIEDLLIWDGCGRDVKPQSRFSFFIFFLLKSHCTVPLMHKIFYVITTYFLVSSPSQDMLSSCCLCWTRCLRGTVPTPSSASLDAVQR